MADIFSVVESKTQALLELLVVIILAGIVTFGGAFIAGMVGTAIPVDSPLVPYVPFISYALTTIATYIAYEYLSPQGLALFKKMLEDMKGQKPKGDEGAVSLWAYFILGFIILVVAVVVYGVFYLNVDLWAPASAILAGALAITGLSLQAKPKITGVTLKDGKALIDWNLFDKSRVYVRAVPEGLLHITFTAGGKSWEALDCRYNPEDGFIYSLRADPTADNTEGMKNDVYLAMDKLSASGAIEYILEKISGKGWNITPIKVRLVLGDAMMAKMSDKDYKDYVDDVNTEVNLTRGWEKFKERDEYFLRRIADDLYYKYYKGSK